MNTPLLSILIPSYNFPKGIKRIFQDSEFLVNNYKIEIILSDDSTDNRVRNNFLKLSKRAFNFKYFSHNPSLGSIKNWNFLLNKSNGKYLWILHHDEFPINENFYRELIFYLENSKHDIFILDFLLSANSQFRRHTPLFLIKIIIRYFPSYFLRRNIIGPISRIIIDKKLYIHFDDNLIYFPDMDFYYRLFIKENYKLLFLPLIIASDFKRRNSITNKLDIDNISVIEKKYLSLKYNSFIFFNVFFNNFSPFFIIDNLIWGLLTLPNRLKKWSS